MVAKFEKVEFGLSSSYFFGMSLSENTWTCEAPTLADGCRTLSTEPAGDEEVVYADNTAWYIDKSTGQMKCELEFIRLTDDFRVKFMGYKKGQGGGLFEVGEDKRIGMMFQTETDDKPNKYVLLNGSMGREKVEYKTNEEKKQYAVTKVEINFQGVQIAGKNTCKCKVAPDDPLYAALFTKPFEVPTAFASAPETLKQGA